MNYWQEAVAEALEVAGLSATDEQIKEVSSWMESAHDCYGETMGLDVVTSNFSSLQQGEIDALEEKLQRERDSIPCPDCAGKSIPAMGGRSQPARYDCWRCNRTGKIYS